MKTAVASGRHGFGKAEFTVTVDEFEGEYTLRVEDDHHPEFWLEVRHRGVFQQCCEVSESPWEDREAWDGSRRDTAWVRIRDVLPEGANLIGELSGEHLGGLSKFTYGTDGVYGVEFYGERSMVVVCLSTGGAVLVLRWNWVNIPLAHVHAA